MTRWPRWATPARDPAADNPLRGRIVLVGGTFAEGRDTYQTPHGLMPGVEVHANVVYMLLSGHFIRPSSWGVSLAINVASPWWPAWSCSCCAR